MPKFHVSIATKEGETYDDTIEAPDRFFVYRVVRERGERVVGLSKKGTGRMFSFAFVTEALHNVSTDEKIILARNLAAMLEAGLAVSRALDVIERQSKNPRLKAVVNQVLGDVNRGDQLSSALAKFPNIFSSLMTAMVRAGEESGKLAESLRIVSGQMERAHALTKRIRGAMIYPAIVIAAMIGIGVLMLLFVVPTLTETFEQLGAELPSTTKFVIALSAFLTEHTLLALGITLALLFGIVAFLRTKRGKRFADWLLLHTPLIKGLVIETNCARVTRTLASLLSSGVDVVSSITITKDVVGNSFYKSVLEEAALSVGKGGQLSESLGKNPTLYPPLVSEMVAVGEETGKFSELLRETAEFYENSVEQKTKDLSTVVEPLLMVVIGAGVGFFALAMIAPIYSLSSSI